MPTGSLRQEDSLLFPMIAERSSPRQMTAEADSEVLVFVARDPSRQPTAVRYRLGTFFKDAGLGAEPSAASENIARLSLPYWRVSNKAWSSLHDTDEPDLSVWQHLLMTQREQLHTSTGWWPQSRQLSQPREEELQDWDVAITTPPNRPSKTILASVEYQGQATPKPVADPEELQDWDVAIMTPPNRPSKTILASVEYQGQATPKPVADPWD